MHRIVNIEAGAVRARFRRPAFAHEWVDFEATAQGDVADRLVDATIAIVINPALKYTSSAMIKAWTKSTHANLGPKAGRRSGRW